MDEEHKTKAEAAMRELKSIGFTVKYFGHVGIIEIVVWRKEWYIWQFPEIAEYGAKYIAYEIKYDVEDEIYVLTINYEDDKKCVIKLFEKNVCICGEMYKQMNYEGCYNIGFIDNNIYADCSMMWIKKEKYEQISDIIESYDMTNLDLFTNNVDDILDLEFRPVKPRQINIMNEGFKIVQFSFIDKTNIDAFTTFFCIDQIGDGKYLENTDRESKELFGYVNEDGELFAYLYDPKTKETTLASASKIVKVYDVDSYIVKCEDGLYNGYEIKNDISKLVHRNDETDNNLPKKLVPNICCYNNIFFTYDLYSKEIIELDARKPNIGAKTKAATAAE